MKWEAFLFNDELELLEARFRETADVVDGYVLVESAKTFTGDSKPLHYAENIGRFEPWNHKVHHVVADLPISDGAWACERAQRDAVHRVIDQLDGNDLVALCDGDELLSRTFWEGVDDLGRENETFVLPMQQYYFTLSWSTPLGPPPNGGLMCRSRIARRRVVSQASAWADAIYPHQLMDSGWHLSCLGGPERLCRKLRSFSHTELSDRSWANVDNCARLIRQGIDIDPNRRWRLFKTEPTGPAWLLGEGVERWPWLLTGGV